MRDAILCCRCEKVIAERLPNGTVDLFGARMHPGSRADVTCNHHEYIGVAASGKARMRRCGAITRVEVLMVLATSA